MPFISPQSLAKAGFYYFNESDHVRCAYCQGVIAKWEAGDDPFAEHLRFFPACSRAQLGPNVEMQSATPIRSLGIQPIATPKKEKYSSLDARIRSFANWKASQIQAAETLAEAGFYYQEEEDQVHCFQCNGGLRAWTKEDDPWYEHAKWFPKCLFISLVKGTQYVEQVQAENKPSLNDIMNTEIVENARSLGFNENSIRTVVSEQLEKNGRSFRDAEELVNILLENDESHAMSCNVSENSLNAPKGESNGEQSSNETLQKASTSGQSNTDASGKNSLSESKLNGKEKPTLSLEEENRLLKDARLCKVCMDEDVAVVFLPCGHLGTCLFQLTVSFEAISQAFHFSDLRPVCSQRKRLSTLSHCDQSFRENVYFVE